MNGVRERRRVMVVDDEELIRWSIEHHLKAGGHLVVSVETGEACLELLRTSEVDVLILDVRLPGMSGLAVLHRARQLRPGIGVIMLTAYGSIDLAVEAMKGGANDFISKPFDLTELQAKVERCAIGRTGQEKSKGREPTRIVGDSKATRDLSELVLRVATSSASTLLIQGESGTGKEVVARAVHEASRRNERPFITVNCSALPEHLIESEFLGHERGAFTDAKEPRAGFVEQADGGTLLLDEIGDMPLGAQAKLLRLVETRAFTRVGGSVERKVDVRIIAATHRDLRVAVAEQKFRHDLYFRLNVMPIQIRPLRERPEDVRPLVAHFVAAFNRDFDRNVRGVSEPALRLLCQHSWPGNVRELRNVIERAFILASEDLVDVDHLPAELVDTADSAAESPEASGEPESLDFTRVQEVALRNALDRAGGNQSQAAKLLGIGRDALRRKMKKLGLL